MYHVRMILVSVLILNAIAACSPSVVTSEQPSSESTTTQSPSPTVELIETEIPITATTETLPPTSLPADTYVLDISPWPDTGNLKNPIDEGVIFETSPSQLPAGDYLISLDHSERNISYVNLSTEETGVFLRLDDVLPLPTLMFIQNGQYILADTSNPRRFYDLSNQTAWMIGPLCDLISSKISSDGQWLHASCKEIQRDAMGVEIHISEIISIKDGIGYRVAVPYSGSIYEIHYAWFNQNRLIISKVRDDSARANCALSVSDQLMYCPPFIEASKNIRYFIQNLGRYVSFQDIDSFPWSGIIIPENCFIPGKDCEKVIDLGEVEGFLVPSPDNTLVGWTTGIGLTGYTKFGYYETTTWESIEIAEIEGNYNIDAWCPDASCLIIYSDEYYSRYRLDIDGTLTPLPYEKIIGSFSIP